jgi:riboflavin kinase/FMN adenylyltransferase
MSQSLVHPSRAVRMPPVIAEKWPEHAVVIGNFDGVHRGHQAVLAEARELGRARGLETLVLTFDPHPAFVLGGTEPPRLTTIARRASLLLEWADRVAVRTFDRAFANTSPEDFAAGLRSELGARLVVVGENFRFGHQRAGDRAQLVELGRALGFEVHAHALAGDAHGRYSSSRARTAVLNGELAVAREVLGRPHSISGTVVKGEQRGRTIGFPTANLDHVTELAPPRGVYAVRVEVIRSPEDALVEQLASLPLRGMGAGLPRGGVPGVMNHGVRPTVGAGGAPSLEIHVFDFEGDLYGQRLRVHLAAKLRDERKFAGLDALKAQIVDDAARARAVLAGKK